jgi:isoleucyl-tRNA synthetase
VVNGSDAALFESIDLAEIAITSSAVVERGEGPADAFRLAEVADAAAVFRPAHGNKCARCWMVLPEVGTVPHHDDLCRRCAAAVETP